MAGVEPASEEKTTRTTTYIVSLSHLVPPHPTDRTLAKQPQLCCLRSFIAHGQGAWSTILSLVGVSLEPDRQVSSRRATYLIKQPVRSCSLHLLVSVLLTCNSEARYAFLTICSPSKPSHPLGENVQRVNSKSKELRPWTISAYRGG
jgi:hypothetical protein